MDNNRSPLGPSVLRLREAEPADLAAVVDLDRRLTGTVKTAYWQTTLERHAGGPPEHCFLVAGDADASFVGFAIGEVRAWEFGSPPVGWVFAIQVDPDRRLVGAGTALFEGLCARFRAAGVDRVRTMVDRKDHLILSFFRSQGMMAGPSIELEMTLDAAIDGGAR